MIRFSASSTKVTMEVTIPSSKPPVFYTPRVLAQFGEPTLGGGWVNGPGRTPSLGGTPRPLWVLPMAGKISFFSGPFLTENSDPYFFGSFGTPPPGGGYPRSHLGGSPLSPPPSPKRSLYCPPTESWPPSLSSPSWFEQNSPRGSIRFILEGVGLGVWFAGESNTNESRGITPDAHWGYPTPNPSDADVAFDPHLGPQMLCPHQ